MFCAIIVTSKNTQEPDGGNPVGLFVLYVWSWQRGRMQRFAKPQDGNVPQVQILYSTPCKRVGAGAETAVSVLGFLLTGGGWEYELKEVV